MNGAEKGIEERIANDRRALVTKRSLCILGIDPGLVRTGWAVLAAQGSELRALAAGVITPPAAEPMGARLSVIYDRLRFVVGKYEPDLAAIERVYVNANPATSLALGQARGVALLALAQAGLSVGEYAPRTVKEAVCGRGGASKEQMRVMLRIFMPTIGAELCHDAADALAVAFCHLHRWRNALPEPSPILKNLATKRKNPARQAFAAPVRSMRRAHRS